MCKKYQPTQSALLYWGGSRHISTNIFNKAGCGKPLQKKIQSTTHYCGVSNVCKKKKV